MEKDIYNLWGVTPGEMSDLMLANPSFMGMGQGYAGEFHLSRAFEGGHRPVFLYKHDDHNRRGKGDRMVAYRGHDISVEVKSIQTASVRRRGDAWAGCSQVDASDSRKVEFPDGTALRTSCLRTDAFDILAVSLFAFLGEWRYVFARIGDLPRSTHREFTPYQREHLLKTTVSVSWPSGPPFRTEPFSLMDEIVAERGGEVDVQPSSSRVAGWLQYNGHPAKAVSGGAVDVGGRRLEVLESGLSFSGKVDFGHATIPLPRRREMPYAYVLANRDVTVCAIVPCSTAGLWTPGVRRGKRSGKRHLVLECPVALADFHPVGFLRRRKVQLG